jgi:hypothetical protein
MTGLSITRLMDETIPKAAIMRAASLNRAMAPVTKGHSIAIKSQLAAKGRKYIRMRFCERGWILGVMEPALMVMR